MLKFAATLLGVSSVSAFDSMAGYVPGSDVTEHSEIDLDVRDFASFAAASDFTSAAGIYENGANSNKTTGFRNLKGFSDNSEKVCLPQSTHTLAHSHSLTHTYTLKNRATNQHNDIHAYTTAS